MATVPSVPVLCPGGTAVVIAGGPSLTLEDVEWCRGKATVVVVNNAYQLAPWADVLYAADTRWWVKWHPDAERFKGLKFTMSDGCPPSVLKLRSAGQRGLATDPSELKTGREGGYQAINLAVHLGPKRILLLGYDKQRGPNGEHHWHGDHPIQHDADHGADLTFYPTMLTPLAQLGVTVINCTRSTKLECFPRMTIQEALPCGLSVC